MKKKIIASDPPAAPKPKRAYVPRMIAPEPPNPAVVAMQGQIVELVNQRSGLQSELANANAHLRNAQACAESARERLQQTEGEVQYRLGLIAQMQGKPAMQGWASEAAFPGSLQPSYAEIQAKLGAELGPTLIPFSAPTGISSIPARRQMDGVEGEVRSESADDIRRSM